MIITDGIHLGSTESEGELHVFAQRIGLKGVWFQDKNKYPHYDLTTLRMRNRAIKYGAKKVNKKDYIRLSIRNQNAHKHNNSHL